MIHVIREVGAAYYWNGFRWTIYCGICIEILEGWIRNERILRNYGAKKTMTREMGKTSIDFSRKIECDI